MTGMRRAGFVLVLAFGAMSAGVPIASAVDPTVELDVFTDASIDGPAGIVAGPDGMMWFANDTGSVSRMSLDGVVLDTYATGYTPTHLAVGADGALWFTSDLTIIGRVTTAGIVSIFADGAILCPRSVAAGPDGNVWFTSYCNGYIGRITPSGVITMFADPMLPGHTDWEDRFSPIDIIAGPDGAMWFTNMDGSWIGRITMTGTMTAFDDPTINWPVDIIVGPDGALWFSNRGDESIGRITMGGAVTNYTDASILEPGPIVTGPDGALWFLNLDSDTIGRVTTAGVVSTPVSGFDGWGITLGPDGNLWVTSASGDAVGRLDVSVPFVFTGFMSPVDNLPTINAMKAGAAVPVKFSLGGDMGLEVLAPGSPSSQRVACTNGGALDAVEVTITAGASALQYDSLTGLYSYVWKTNKAWTGTCRLLNLELTDGSVHQAMFLFR